MATSYCNLGHLYQHSAETTQEKVVQLALIKLTEAALIRGLVFFFGKKRAEKINKKKNIIWSSAEFAYTVVKVKR